MTRWSPNNPVNQYICKRIRKRRIELGINQTDLAHNIEVSYQQLQKYEAGKNTPSGAKIWLIACYLDVPITYFYPPTVVGVPY
ncbi:MAG: helix-turn-helix transcriptional regulator [Kordiimonadaceae bacterium]|nr:helix-turn-helix transcriptional regulator [Kordiimonadaceae bacterium]